MKKATTSSIKKLSAEYGVHPATLRKWLVAYPEIGLDKSSRVLTPKQVHLIYERLGEP